MPACERLASYIATSARWTSVCTSSPWSGQSATPMLASSSTATPRSANGRPRASCRRPASSATAARSGRSGSSTANSSPPRRASVSPRRSAPRSRAATSTSSSSPWSWPSVSLTSLKRSRSISISAASRSPRAEPMARSQARVEQRAVRQAGQPVVQRLVAQPPRGARDDPEERDEQHGEADAEQQVEREQVGVDLVGDGRVGHVDLERAGAPRGVVEAQRHVDLERAHALPVVGDAALEVRRAPAAQRLAHAGLVAIVLADQAVVVRVDDLRPRR